MNQVTDFMSSEVLHKLPTVDCGFEKKLQIHVPLSQIVQVSHKKALIFSA